MEKLYHGSSVAGIKRLEPKKSTHGTYVYATPFKELAIIFSARCGDDLTYSLYRDGKYQPWKLVERIPYGFDVMYSNESSLYTVSDETFKDIHTGFSEVVSEVGVDTIDEIQIKNVYEEIKKYSSLGVVEIYRYPNRPNDIPIGDYDLLQRIVRRYQKNNKPITKKSFERLLYLHPNLLSSINDVLLENDQETFKVAELVDIFETHLAMQMLEPDKEQYIKSSAALISMYYPKLIPSIKEKLNILDKDKDQKMHFIFDNMDKRLSNYPKGLVDLVRKFYENDERDFSDICAEISGTIKK